MHRFPFITLGAALVFFSAPILQAQLWTWTKEQMLEYTNAWKGLRFPDGRPKVSDEWLARAKDMSMEEVMIRNTGERSGNPYSQYEGGFRVLHPEIKMAGRAVTMAFLPARSDLDHIVRQRAREKGIEELNNQYVIDMLRPGDVLVVDLYGKQAGGTIVGDNLFYYLMKATHGGGLVVDGSIRDLDGITPMAMPCYYRSVHPSPISGVTLVAVNVPVRIGNVTVVPGDLVVGDAEGVSFIPPQDAEAILDRADEIHVHDEWTRKKFDEGGYKSSDIYSTPRDPALRKEYEQYLKKRLAEIRAARKH